MHNQRLALTRLPGVYIINLAFKVWVHRRPSCGGNSFLSATVPPTPLGQLIRNFVGSIGATFLLDQTQLKSKS